MSVLSMASSLVRMMTKKTTSKGYAGHAVWKGSEKAQAVLPIGKGVFDTRVFF